MHFVLIAAALISAPNSSQSAPRASVEVADLDLDSKAGQHLLRRRLADAVEEVCGSYATVVEYSEELRITDCRRAAGADAARQLAERHLSVQLAATAH